MALEWSTLSLVDLHRVLVATSARALIGAVFAMALHASWQGSASAAPAHSAPRTQALIYGDDDRKEPDQVDAGPIRDLALHSSFALVPRASLGEERAGLVTFDALTLGETLGLCGAERFASQPALANCSATLVDADLLLTAAHCVDTWPCETQLWALGYAMTDVGPPTALETGDLYRCRAVPTRAYEKHEHGLRLDYAVVQLDRPVAGGHPAALAHAWRAEVGAPLTVIGYPNGLPVKVVAPAPLLDPRRAEGDYFVLASDTFVGSSGSGVFDEQDELIGILVRGGNDYEYDAAARCSVTRKLPAGEVGSGEHASVAARALGALCDSGWPSERLCGKASQCGDGWCSVDEHTGPCTADCPNLPLLLAHPAESSGCTVNRAAGSSSSAHLVVLLLLAFFRPRNRCKGTATSTQARTLGSLSRAPRAESNLGQKS